MARWMGIGLLALAGCGTPTPEAALRQGDVVRPQFVFAPEQPWPAGGKVGIGILVEVHRPGREGISFLHEEDIPLEGVAMRAKVTFLKGDLPLSKPLEVPFMRDC